MAHCAKYSKASIGHMTKHYERARDSNGEYVKFGNEQIDSTRTHLNYNLAPDRQQVDFIRKRLSEVYCLKRADVNVMCTWVVTAPRTLPKEHEKEFFQTVYRHLEEKYGKQNVISSYVHMDETRPHMHFAFIPVTYDRKKNREKVSAKEVVTRAELKRFHGSLQEEIDRWQEQNGYDFECNMLNGATENGNLTIQGLKAEELEKLNQNERELLDELVDMNNEMGNVAEELQREVDGLAGERQGLEAVKNALENRISSLEDRVKELNSSQLMLMRNFVESPAVKPLFDKFCNGMRERYQKMGEERAKQKTEKGTLEYYKEQIAKRHENQTFSDNSDKQKRSQQSHDEDER